MKYRALLICFMLGSPLGLSRSVWAHPSDDQKPPVPCPEALLPGDRFFIGDRGRLKDFKLKVTPKFTQVELRQARAELTPKNSKYKLGETGNFEIYAENRLIPGFAEPQIVAVKYEKDNRTAQEKEYARLLDLTFGSRQSTESEQIVSALQSQHAVFKELGLLKYFDVLLPLDYGSDFVVMPIVYGESLDQITLRAIEAQNPPERYRRAHVESLGPVPMEADAHLARVWRAQQFGMRQVLKVLKAHGYRVADKYFSKAWPSGEKYLSSVVLQKGNQPLLTLNTDQMISVDGRLVVHDPY